MVVSYYLEKSYRDSYHINKVKFKRKMAFHNQIPNDILVKWAND